MTERKSWLGRVLRLSVPPVAAALLLSGCGGTEGEVGASEQSMAAATAGASRSFTCTQTSSSRGTYRQAVSGTLDAANVPHGVVVTRVRSGAVEISSANPTLIASYDGGYWKRTYGLDAWYLGAAGTNPNFYYFNMPPSPGATFTAMLKTDFGTNAKYGSWQHWMACTAQ